MAAGAVREDHAGVPGWGADGRVLGDVLCRRWHTPSRPAVCRARVWDGPYGGPRTVFWPQPVYSWACSRGGVDFPSSELYAEPPDSVSCAYGVCDDY